MLDQLTLFRVGIGLAYGDHLLLAEEHGSPLKSALVNARVVTISSKSRHALRMAQNGEPSGRQSRLSTITGPSTPELLDWTFNHVLRNACLHHPNRTAVISQHQDESYSYLELQTRSNRLAFGLHSLGVRKGDRVGVPLGNRSEYVDVSCEVT